MAADADRMFAPVTGTTKSASTKRRGDAWVPVLPIEGALIPKPRAHPKKGMPAAEWAYRDCEGRLLGYVWRISPLLLAFLYFSRVFTCPRARGFAMLERQKQKVAKRAETMKKAITGWVLTLALSATGLTGLASTIDKNPNVRVIGLGLHQETSRDIYMGALYIGKLQTTPADPVIADGPRVMEYRILARRTSVRSLLGNMMLQGELATGTSAGPEVQQLAGDIMAAVQGSLYAGDSFAVSTDGSSQTTAILNGTVLGSVDDPAVADYLFKGWVSENGPTTAFRRGLMDEEKPGRGLGKN